MAVGAQDGSRDFATTLAEYARLGVVVDRRRGMFISNTAKATPSG